MLPVTVFAAYPANAAAVITSPYARLKMLVMPNWSVNPRAPNARIAAVIRPKPREPISTWIASSPCLGCHKGLHPTCAYCSAMICCALISPPLAGTTAPLAV
jgi:hypothetical protein